MISNFKTALFIVLILAISSKGLKKQMDGSQSAPAQEQPRPDIMDVAFKSFIANANLDFEDFVRGAKDFSRDMQMPEPSREELRAIFDQVDADHDGRMSGLEFKGLIEYLKAQNENNGAPSFVQKVPFRSWIQKNQNKNKHWFTKW